MWFKKHLFLWLIAGCASSPRTALLVGINHYADPELTELRGPGNDVTLVSQMLREDFNFGSITILRDAQATRSKILAGLDDLIKDATSESVIVFYFSGHGAQVLDASGDEPDGWDETLVPYDSGRAGRPNLDITDDELAPRLDALARKAGSVTFVLDSCYGGTAGRAERGVRGASPGGPVPQTSQVEPTDTAYTLIAASAAEERAFERPNPAGRWHGLLTWHLVDALRSAPSNTTWREIIAQVKQGVGQRMANQHPQLEGAGRDRVALGIKLHSPGGWVRATPAGMQYVKISAGAAHGVGVGDVYEIGQYQARITEVQAHAAIAQLDRKVTLSSATQAWLLQRAPSGDPLRIYGASPRVLRVLKKRGDIAATTEPDLAHLRIMSDHLIEPVGPGWPISSEAALIARIIRWSSWHTTHKLSHDDPTLPVEFTVIPNRPVTVGEALTLQIKSQSTARLFLTLLSISGDGQVSVLYPDPGVEAALEPMGEWHLTVNATLPDGVQSSEDRLKVILTTEPVDFRFLEQGRSLLGPTLFKSRWTTRSRNIKIMAKP